MKLVEPNSAYKEQYHKMIEDWKSTGEFMVPFSIRYDISDFDAFIKKTNSFKTKRDEGFVHHSTFWLMDESDNILGVSNLRHYLNDKLLIQGGHIGYGIRPSERRKGYATKILELSLIEAKKLGIDKALITCYKENIGSTKTIIKNGGKLWKEHNVEGKEVLNFWIDIK